MDVSKEFLEMVNEDIGKLKKANTLSAPDQLQLHREIDGRYQSCVQNWNGGLHCTYSKGISYSRLNKSGSDAVLENLGLMKAKLESFRFGVNAVKGSNPPATNVHVTTNVNIDITFEQAKEKVQDMTFLTDEETQEILERISQLESTINGTGSKKSKWEAMKPTLTWLAKESFDVAKVVLPLLLKV